jgi:hypothetical protein
MKKRFVVCLDASATREQEQEFLNFVKSNRYGWWHWLPNTWLIVDGSGNLDRAVLRDEVVTSYPEVFNLVLEIPAEVLGLWSGFGVSSPKKDMFKWIRENWEH